MNDIANQERQVLGSRALRMKRARRIMIVLGLFVCLPTLVAGGYFGLMATAQYESVAVFTVESGGATDAATKKGTPEERDLQIARSHMRSRAMLDALVKDHAWVSHYQGADVDWWSRLGASAGSEKTFDYFLGHIEVRPESKFTFTLHVYAFSPERARELAEAIVTATERHLVKQSEVARTDVLESARVEVEASRERFVAAGKANVPELDMEVARSRLASAMRGLELAEIEAARRKRTLVIIAEPSTPNEASRPRRLWNIATVLVTALALGVMFLLLGDFIREHAKF